MKLGIALLLVIAKASLAAPPDGLSFWEFSSCETPEIQERMQCNPYSAELTVLYNNGKICGWIDQSWFNKSPSAGFIATNYYKNELVKFADSFQENERDFGWAILRFTGTGVEWKVLKSPRGGMVGDVSELRRVQEHGVTELHIPTSCAKLKEMTGAPFPLDE